MSICPICKERHAELRLTWVNDAGSGISGGLQGGPMCNPCGQMIWDALSRFPNARDTTTISPLEAA